MEKVLQDLKDLFAEAKTKSEFHFIMTLINYRGMGDTYETSNLYEWFDAIEDYTDMYRGMTGKQKTRIGCLLYATFFEGSEYYNILGSLCLNAMGYQGSSYLYWKTPKYGRLLGTEEKIDSILERLVDCKKDHIVKFYQDNHFAQIRNSFFHSAYSLVNNSYILHDTENIVTNGHSFGSFDVNSFLYPKIDNVIAFFQTFKGLYLSSWNSYTKDKVVQGFFGKPTDITILGSNKGLNGWFVKGTTSFFGQPADTWVKYDVNYSMWTAMNLEMLMPRVEDIEVDQRLSRFEAKPDNNTKDSEFMNLIDKVAQRRNPPEVIRMINLFTKFANARFKKWKEEPNQLKKPSLKKYAIEYLQMIVDLVDKLKAAVDISEVKAAIEQLEKDDKNKA
jgi:hypothetical protein